MKFEDWEYFSDIRPPISSPDGIEDNWGVGHVTTIFDRSTPGAPAVWNEGDNGEYLRFIYWGLDLSYWSGDPGDFKTVAATGGAGLAIYLHDSDLPGFLPLDISGGPGARSGTPGAYSYPTITDGNGILLAMFEFAPGIDPTDSTALTIGTTYGLGLPPTGHGAGYLDVIPGTGPLADLLDEDPFSTAWGDRDIFMEFDFRAPGDYDWQLNSDDPVIGVPEPNTIILLGAGLLGVGFFTRRRVKK
jgi:hypothetical protein